MTKLQHILFNVGLPPENKILENTQPSVILAGSIAAAFGLPGTVEYIKPLVVSQGRKKRSHIFHLASKAALTATRSLSALRGSNASASAPRRSLGGELPIFSNRIISNGLVPVQSPPQSPDLSIKSNFDYNQEQAYSLPNLHAANPVNVAHKMNKTASNNSISSILTSSSLPPSLVSQQKHIEALKSNYFYCETQFMDALQKISNKLTNVPKQARLSSLRVEIAMLNKDLPAEVDIPLLLPSPSSSSSASIRSHTSSASTYDYRLGELPSKQNRVVRIVPSEAVLLNSAERVPYLLLIEYIRSDLDFDTSSDRNKAIISHEANRKHIFDTISTPLHDQYSMSAPSSARNSEDANVYISRRTRAMSATEYSARLNSSRNTPSFHPGDEIIPKEESDMGDISVIDLFEDKRAIMANDRLSASLSSLASLNSSSLPSSSLGTFSTQTFTSGSHLSSANYYSASPRSSDLSFSPVYMTPVHRGDDIDQITDLATHMRTAAVMINQLEGSKLSKEEIERIKNKIISSMQSMEEHTIYQNSIGTGVRTDDEAGIRKLENDLLIAGMDEAAESSGGTGVSNELKGLPPTSTTLANATATAASKGTLNLGEDWRAKKERIRRSSPYGHLPNWDLFSCIVKTGSDLRQEAFACQLIQAMQMCWDRANTGVWVKRMRILITHNSAGLVETITNALSIHSIKKAMSTLESPSDLTESHNSKKAIPSLKSYFEMTFGSGNRYESAVGNFVRSLAGYSIICYLLQVKDRHNGNILLDNDGHIVHIDFGFLLSNTPGSVGFETSPFKLTYEYIELMGGTDSETFTMFKNLVKQGFKDIRKEAESIIILVEMMQRDSTLPCFASGAATAQQLRQRFQLQMSDSEVDNFVEYQLIQKSSGSLSTRLYDQFQFLTQGIYS